MKRSNDRGQLRKEEYMALESQADNETEGKFTQATPEQLAQRKIVKSRRPILPPPVSEPIPGANPFRNSNLLAPSPAATFAFNPVSTTTGTTTAAASQSNTSLELCNAFQDAIRNAPENSNWTPIMERFVLYYGLQQASASPQKATTTLEPIVPVVPTNNLFNSSASTFPVSVTTPSMPNLFSKTPTNVSTLQPPNIFASVGATPVTSSNNNDNPKNAIAAAAADTTTNTNNDEDQDEINQGNSEAAFMESDDGFERVYICDKVQFWTYSKEEKKWKKTSNGAKLSLERERQEPFLNRMVVRVGQHVTANMSMRGMEFQSNDERRSNGTLVTKIFFGGINDTSKGMQQFMFVVKHEHSVLLLTNLNKLNK